MAKPITSQNMRILAHLRVAPITAFEALKYAGCMRLGARIYELRERGHKIDSVLVEVGNERGEIKRVAKYFLRREAK